jgi:hypothetical protein
VTERPSTATLPGSASLIVKCLKCRQTYDVQEVSVTMTAVLDEDSGEFVQYDVNFTHFGGDDPVYIQDMLCLPKHCSVFGRLTSGTMFAFAWLVPGRKGDRWHSKPDNRGKHYAMRGPAA